MEDGGLVRGASLLEEMMRILDEDPSPSRISTEAITSPPGMLGVDDRGASFMLQVQEALRNQEMSQKGDEEGYGKRARELDLQQMEELFRGHGFPAGEERTRPQGGRGGTWEELDALLNTRATKVSVEAVEESDLVLWAGTWNVANKAPSGDLTPWLMHTKEGKVVAADMYFIGLQEVDMSVASAVMLVTRRGQEWLEFVHRSMMKLSASQSPVEQYTKVLARQLGGILTFCYVKSKHLNLITELSSGVACVGMMGMGNKGAVAIRMKLRSRTLCVVTAHLSSGQESGAFERRAQDLAEINKRLLFFECTPSVEGSNPLQPLFFSPPLTIDAHSSVIWIGDLNFRLRLSYHEALALAKRRDFRLMLQCDELLRAMASYKIFPGFDEGVLDFAPTYKYDVGTANYDTSNKQRTPSWTDRVVWKGRSMTLLDYTDVGELQLSDHRPVKALLILRWNIREGRQFSPDDLGEHVQHYHLEKQQDIAVDSTAQAPLLRWGSQGFNGLGETSAFFERPETFPPLSKEESSFLQLSGTLKATNVFPEGVPPLPLAESGRWLPSIELVSPDDYRSVALRRLAVVLSSTSLAWINAATRNGVKIQVLNMGGNSAAWLKGEIKVRHTVDEIGPLLQDPARREEWDNTLVDGVTLQTYDEAHSIQRLVRGLRHEGASDNDEAWDFALLQSKHYIDEGVVIILFQSIKHRLIPQNPKYIRSTLGFEAYALRPDGAGCTVLTIYLQIAADGTAAGRKLVAVAEEIISSTANLEVLVSSSRASVGITPNVCAPLSMPAS